MKAKILLWSVVSFLTTGFAAEAFEKAAMPGQASDSDHSQMILLSDGTKLTLLGVTYGKRHVAPNFEAIGGSVQLGNWIDSAKDETVVWIEAEHDPSRWPSYQLLVSDVANTACVAAEQSTRSHVKDGVDVQGFMLRSFPRWDKEVLLRVKESNIRRVAKGQFLISN